VSIIETMVIDMNEGQVRTLEQVRQAVAGTQALEFRRAEGDEGRYARIAQVLQRLGYRQLGRGDRGAVLAYLQRLSGFNRAQVTRLVSRWMPGGPLAKNYRAAEHAFARRYTPADVALLAEVDRAMGTLSGPAAVCVLRRQRDVFGDARFERLGSISMAHLYNLRKGADYRQQRVVLTKTRGDKAVTIGVRKAPAPNERPGFVRIDSVHQGDFDGIKGLYHINAVDASPSGRSWLRCRRLRGASAAEQMLAQFPFEIDGQHLGRGIELHALHEPRRLDSQSRLKPLVLHVLLPVHQHSALSPRRSFVGTMSLQNPAYRFRRFTYTVEHVAALSPWGSDLSFRAPRDGYRSHPQDQSQSHSSRHTLADTGSTLMQLPPASRNAVNTKENCSMRAETEMKCPVSHARRP